MTPPVTAGATAEVDSPELAILSGNEGVARSVWVPWRR
jgi:hypothetical protein